MTAFEWDEAKNVLNLAKHRISFEEAAKIFEGPVLTYEDQDSDQEVRERSYGLLNGIVVVCVVHTLRGEKTRIISARKATKQERNLFHAYLKKACS
ncbi:MAG TPA: BrnT family toxin [Bradyrhizobium sp.]|uniref:BrnT family toxin n=1 Tax=Bradyrhizobium sp. TaxID=376 RepID=UPI002BB3C33E|nr:BrnT family toxin [Bradyrhizobium sp.]HLZ04672.1 BrnT family toxin [Bradyrhizobium sp.]